MKFERELHAEVDSVIYQAVANQKAKLHACLEDSSDKTKWRITIIFAIW